MLRSFLTWLEDEVTDNGIVRVVESTLTLLAFGALLSTILGSSAIKAAALVVAMLTFLALFSLLALERRQWQAERARDQRLIARYCQVIKDQLDMPLHMIRWDDTAIIEANGDTNEVIALHGRVESERLYFIRLRIGPGWQQPEKDRKRVSFEVRSTQVLDTGGVRWETTQRWLTDGRLELVAHTHIAAPKSA